VLCNSLKKNKYATIIIFPFLNDIFNTLIYLIDVLIVLLPMLLSVAFMTIIERKQLAAHQRRVGPTDVGVFGVVQPFC
jgi:NADH-ubiquinone oxidoreductase chain 1